MQSKILERKLLVKKNNDYIVDLTTKSIEYQRYSKAIDVRYIGEDMTMRVDLISKAVYGIEEEWDIILKYNGISNPFSINENEEIFIPDLSFMYESIVNPQAESIDDNIRNQYIDESKTPTVDTNKLEYDKLIKRLQENGPSNLSISSYNLPPNISAPGESEARILSNGNVIFGDYVTKSK